MSNDKHINKDYIGVVYEKSNGFLEYTEVPIDQDTIFKSELEQESALKVDLALSEARMDCGQMRNGHIWPVPTHFTMTLKNVLISITGGENS